MGSELSLLALVALELVVLSTVARYGREWLYGGIVVNLLLVSTLGAKTISLWGFETNSGNIFYASAIFASLLLVEMYGVISARRSVMYGAAAIIFFLVASQIVIGMPGTDETAAVDIAMRQLFDFVPRVAVASLVALMVSQSLAITLYDWMKSRHGDHLLWARNLSSVFVSQIFDSLIFFSIAFLGTVSTAMLWQFMLTGFAIKLLFGAVSTMFFYMNHLVIKVKD